MTSIVWFRRDLRLNANPALSAAVKEGGDVIPLYILDTDPNRAHGAAQNWWLHHSLDALGKSLAKKGAELILRRGDPIKIFEDLCKAHSIDSIYWNCVFEPHQLELDDALKNLFSEYEINAKRFNANLLTNPDSVKNKSGTPFKVYTPYWKTVRELIRPALIQVAPKSIDQSEKPKTESLSDWDLLPTKPDWSKGFSIWTPGEAGAQKRFQAFLTDNIGDYGEERDRPDLSVTSQLSPHIHFGELSIREMWQTVSDINASDKKRASGALVFLKQLVWREFSYYLLYHFPKLDTENFRPEFDRFQWNRKSKRLEAWQKGQTGYPIVDAGMRELWHTGTMHNRVRMIVASFLTKDLFFHWREGAQWFWDTLLDADLANNSASWQWVAGSGADAAPYFRIFNPILQGQKFDPEGHYVRQWVPELKLIPDQYLHFPSDAPEKVLSDAGVTLGADYPNPIVDHREARAEAMKRYQAIK